MAAIPVTWFSLKVSYVFIVIIANIYLSNLQTQFQNTY